MLLRDLAISFNYVKQMNMVNVVLTISRFNHSRMSTNRLGDQVAGIMIENYFVGELQVLQKLHTRSYVQILNLA